MNLEDSEEEATCERTHPPPIVGRGHHAVNFSRVGVPGTKRQAASGVRMDGATPVPSPHTASRRRPPTLPPSPGSPPTLPPSPDPLHRESTCCPTPGLAGRRRLRRTASFIDRGGRADRTQPEGGLCGAPSQGAGARCLLWVSVKEIMAAAARAAAGSRLECPKRRS